VGSPRDSNRTPGSSPRARPTSSVLDSRSAVAASLRAAAFAHGRVSPAQCIGWCAGVFITFAAAPPDGGGGGGVPFFRRTASAAAAVAAAASGAGMPLYISMRCRIPTDGSRLSASSCDRCFAQHIRLVRVGGSLQNGATRQPIATQLSTLTRHRKQRDQHAVVCATCRRRFSSVAAANMKSAWSRGIPMSRRSDCVGGEAVTGGDGLCERRSRATPARQAGRRTSCRSRTQKMHRCTPDRKARPLP
jgi:hypothetical protein